MIRRKFIFADHAAKKLYASPEFNGSMEEYQARGVSLDACDLSVLELQKLFQVNSLEAFNSACETAQNHYYSVLGRDTYLAAVEVSPDQLCDLQADEIIFVINGQLIPAYLGWDGNMTGLCTHIDNMAKIAQTLTALFDGQGICALEYHQVLKISDQELDVIQRYLSAVREDDYQSPDNIITHTAQFPDGMQMDIKCCGSQDGPSWTEAVLFDQNGQELTCTEVCEEYMRLWELEYSGIKYFVFVTNTGNVLRLSPSQTGPVDAEGICPVCGAEIDYCDSHEMTDDGGLIPWKCPSCGATGKEGYNRVFDQHYDVCSENEAPIPN